jgi:hypothetical protein
MGPLLRGNAAIIKNVHVYIDSVLKRNLAVVSRAWGETELGTPEGFTTVETGATEEVRARFESSLSASKSHS